MTRHGLVVLAGLAVVAGCSSGAPKANEFATAACPVVMQWADDSVTAVNVFQEQSRQLTDAAARRAAYLAAFARLEETVASLSAHVAALPYPDEDGAEIRQRLDTMIMRVRAEYADDRQQAESLPDTAFTKISVNDGHLVTGNEKAKAIVFETIGKLWQDFKIVDENCGRHPPVTVDLDPG
jgi:hypothetical protein